MILYKFSSFGRYCRNTDPVFIKFCFKSPDHLLVPLSSSLLHQFVFNNHSLCHELLASGFHPLHGLSPIRLYDYCCYLCAANQPKASPCAPPTNLRPCTTHTLREHLLQGLRWLRSVPLPHDLSDVLISTAAILPSHQLSIITDWTSLLV